LKVAPWIILTALLVPPVPHQPAKPLQSPKAAAMFVGKSSSAIIDPLPSTNLSLVWDYPTNTVLDWKTNVAFELWHVIDFYTTNTVWGTNEDGSAVLITNICVLMTNWQVYASVTGALSCPVTATQQVDIFKIRSIDTRFGVYSDWAKK
jgi:hypothetical protein